MFYIYDDKYKNIPILYMDFVCIETFLVLLKLQVFKKVFINSCSLQTLKFITSKMGHFINCLIQLLYSASYLFHNRKQVLIEITLTPIKLLRKKSP